MTGAVLPRGVGTTAVLGPACRKASRRGTGLPGGLADGDLPYSLGDLMPEDGASPVPLGGVALRAPLHQPRGALAKAAPHGPGGRDDVLLGRPTDMRRMNRARITRSH